MRVNPLAVGIISVTSLVTIAKADTHPFLAKHAPPRVDFTKYTMHKTSCGKLEKTSCSHEAFEKTLINPQRCLEKLAAHNCTATMNFLALHQRTADVTSNKTHSLYGMTIPDSLRLHRNGMSGFMETFDWFRLEPKGKDTKLLGFKNLLPQGGTYSPSTIFEPGQLMGFPNAKLTNPIHADDDVYMSWLNSPPTTRSSDLSSWTGDITIGVMTTTAESTHARMEKFDASLFLTYSLMK